MRRVVANAMLCLLLLLSVAAAQCEVRCTVSAMPMQSADAGAAGAAMDPGMQDCDGMQAVQPGLAVAHAACDSNMCTHQALPSASDSRIDVDTAASLQVVVLPVLNQPVVLPSSGLRTLADRPPLPQCSPLDQTSSLRV